MLILNVKHEIYIIEKFEEINFYLTNQEYDKKQNQRVLYFEGRFTKLKLQVRLYYDKDK